MRFIATAFSRPVKNLNCVCVCVFVISFPCTSRETISHTHLAHTYCPSLQGQYLQFILFCKITLSHCLTISPSLPFPCLPLCLSLHCQSLLLYVSMAERDQGQLWFLLSVQGILWKQYITGNSCQSISPSICVSSPSLVLVLHVVIHSPHSCRTQLECG